jgi:uncharacterized protein YndB with AHSA1/START domain
MKDTGTFSVTTPTDREIVMTRIFDAPRRIVFEAWTKAEHVVHWWDPSGVPLSVCEIDLRPNGAFRWVHGGAGGGAYSFTGAYREITPPERLVFATRMFPSSPESVGTLVFTEDRGKTKLTMTIECNSIEDRDALLKMRVDAGTARTLENLAEHLHKMAQAADFGVRKARE